MKFARFLPILLLSAVAALHTVPATAMDNEVLNGRLESLERNLMLLQRQVARGGDAGSADSGGPTGAPPQTEARIDAMEEEMRQLRGKLEESQFQSRKNAETLEKFQKDAEYRFSQLEAAAVAHANETPVAAPAPAASAPVAEDSGEKPRKPIAGNSDGMEPVSPKPKPATELKPNPKVEGKVSVKSVGDEDAKPEADAKQPANPREHYNDAFRLLNQNKYDEAATGFKSFIKKYPKDPLAGNANYWLGEIHYMNHDFVEAADNFRQGFETAPSGPKAPDNLLKLAMSLSSLKHNKESCVVLRQVINKFGKSSSTAVRKAENEQKRIGCE